MSNPATLYRFRLTVSDIDRGFYGDIDFRLGMHPSETIEYLLTRVLAYALSYEDGIVATSGLCTADEPAMSIPDGMGGIGVWIDIGNPSARRMHKASKAARQVRIFTYKDPDNLKREAAQERIHRAETIEIFSLEPRFLTTLSKALKRDNTWAITHTDGEVVVSAGEETFMTTLTPHRLEA